MAPSPDSSAIAELASTSVWGATRTPAGIGLLRSFAIASGVFLLTVGCGSDALSEQEFVELAQPICDGLSAQLDASDFLDLGPPLRAAADALAELDAPAGPASQLVNSFTELADAHAELASATSETLQTQYSADEISDLSIWFAEDGTVLAGEDTRSAGIPGVPEDSYLSVAAAIETASEAASQLSLEACAIDAPTATVDPLQTETDGLFAAAIPGVEPLPVDTWDYTVYDSPAERAEAAEFDWGVSSEDWTVEVHYGHSYIQDGEEIKKVIARSVWGFNVPEGVSHQDHLAGHAWAAAKAASTYWSEPARVVAEGGGSADLLPALAIDAQVGTDLYYTGTGELVTYANWYQCKPGTMVAIASGQAGPEEFLTECLEE